MIDLNEEEVDSEEVQEEEAEAEATLVKSSTMRAPQNGATLARKIVIMRRIARTKENLNVSIAKNLTPYKMIAASRISNKLVLQRRK